MEHSGEAQGSESLGFGLECASEMLGPCRLPSGLPVAREKRDLRIASFTRLSAMVVANNANQFPATYLFAPDARELGCGIEVLRAISPRAEAMGPSLNGAISRHAIHHQ